MSGDRRLKASDVFNQSTPLLGTTSNFDEAFPGLADLSVRVRETDWDQTEVRLHHYTKGSVGRFVDCSNPRCYNGGFNLQSFVNLNTYGQERLSGWMHEASLGLVTMDHAPSGLMEL